MVKETQEQREKRRKALGFQNPKKDKWARRKRPLNFITPKKKVKKKVIKKSLPIKKQPRKTLKWYQKIINKIKKWLKLI